MNSLVSKKVFLNADQEVVEYDGSPLSWRVSAYALVRKNNEILIIKNKTEKLYDIVGGGVEFGENIDEALARECLEEAGVVVKLEKLLRTHVDWFYHKKEHKFYQTLQLFYEATLLERIQAPTEKDIEWQDFVPVSEIGTQYRLPPIAEAVIKQNILS